MCGLSQKQIWRRQAPAGKSRLLMASITPPNVDLNTMSNSGVADREVKDQAAAGESPSTVTNPVVQESSGITIISSAKQCCESTGKNKAIKQAKGVSFCGYVKVVLIPCVADYREANLCDILWWTASDMKGFHSETALSLRKYMHDTQVKDRKRALRMLLEDETAALSTSFCV